METPNAAQITAALATIGMIAQYFGFVLPTQNRADANRDANWSCRDALTMCNEERDEYKYDWQVCMEQP